MTRPFLCISGLANTTATYTNCIFNTANMYLYRSAKFIGCTFNDTETYALWICETGTVEFEDCTFVCERRCFGYYFHDRDNFIKFASKLQLTFI